MSKLKAKDPWVLFGHCVIWTGVISFILSYLGILTLWKVLFLFFGHLFCDLSKHRLYHKLPFHIKNSIDQGFHLFQLLIVCFL
ncbi:MAG: hypothetical protein ACTSR2_00935 [Candidatus Hodarchaeales archaeon]